MANMLLVAGSWLLVPVYPIRVIVFDGTERTYCLCRRLYMAEHFNTEITFKDGVKTE
jgi:hypothetical protein